MKKRILCAILAVLMLVPFVFSAQATGADEPSIAIWVNGNWVAAKSVSGLSGDVWVEFPIDAAVLTEGADNYVRITSNVANGATADTQLTLLGTACGWSNSFISHNWWVDSDWASLGTVNPDIAIEGWNGSAWIRIHNDHDCYADTNLILGNVGGADYQGYARNIWTDANTLANYSNFRIRAHMNIGSNLTVMSGDILNLFPAANYHACTFCATCGGCTNASCTLNHVACNCAPAPTEPYATPSVAVYVNGSWVAAKSLTGLSGDAWVEIPIAASVLTDTENEYGGTNYVRITSNVANGATADTQLALYGSNCGWSNTYISHNWWVDSDWAGIGDVNADLVIEGWNGSRWIRIHNDHDCIADASLTLGNVGGSDYQGYARNIWVDSNTIANYTNFRVLAHFNIGSNLTVMSGDILNLFPTANYHACTFCATCGGCLNASCTLSHVACTCGQDDPDEPTENIDNNLTFATVNLQLESYIGADFFFLKTKVADYDSYYVRFAYPTADGDVTEDLPAEEYGKYFFAEHTVAAKEMSDTIQATIYAVKDGVTFHGPTTSWKLKDAMRTKFDGAKSTEADKALCVAILNYGAKAQARFSYNVEDLATSVLTAEEIATYLPAARAAVSVDATTSNGLTGVTFYKMALSAGSVTVLNVMFTKAAATDIDDVECRISYTDRAGAAQVEVIDSFTASGSRYVALFNKLTAKQLGDTISITFYSKTSGEPISETKTFSEESYIALNPSANEAQTALYTALIQYADAAAAKFA